MRRQNQQVVLECRRFQFHLNGAIAMNDKQLADDWKGLGNYPYKTVREKVRSAFARKGIYPNRSDLEELTQEGIAFCWRYFREFRPKAENAKHAVLVTARQAARSVSKGERFVADTQGRRSVVTQCADDLDSIPSKPTAQHTSDHRKAERIISALPRRLQGIARLLAYGDSVKAIAHKQNRHPKTIEKYIREMREYISLT